MSIEQSIFVRNADIELVGVSLSGIYINKDRLIQTRSKITDVRSTIEERLHARLNTLSDFRDVEWGLADDNDEFNRSYSAYQTITKREHVVMCSLGNIPFASDLSASDPLTGAAITDVRVTFHEFGNVLVTGRLKLSDRQLTLSEYRQVSDCAHSLFGSALKQKVATLVETYVTVMHEIDQDLDIEVNLVNLPHDLERPSRTSGFVYDNTLNFAIRHHMIYDSDLLQMENPILLFREVLTGEWEPGLSNIVRLSDAVIYSGWTHSMTIASDEGLGDKALKFDKYRLPLEVVVTDWGALRALSTLLDMARPAFVHEVERLNLGRRHKRNFNEVARRIRHFTLCIERVMESFDSYSVSNNPMYYRLIDIQQDVFMESKNVQKVRAKLELVSRIVDELSARQRTLQADRLNKALLTLTFFTVIEISQVVDTIIHSGAHLFYVTLGIGLTLSSIVLLAYLDVFHLRRRRKWQRKRARTGRRTNWLRPKLLGPGPQVEEVL